MSDDQERSLRLAAKANRERLAVAHREAVLQDEEKKAFDIRQNMARLKERSKPAPSTQEGDSDKERLSWFRA